MTPGQIYKLACQLLVLAEQAASGGMLFYCLDDKTVLLTKRSLAVKNPRAWDIQGGRADEDDSNEKITAIREAHEELGTFPNQKKLIGKHLLQHKQHEYMIYVYKISAEEKRKWTPEIKLDFESTGFRWFPIDKLPADTHIDLQWLPLFIKNHS